MYQDPGKPKGITGSSGELKSCMHKGIRSSSGAATPNA